MSLVGIAIATFVLETRAVPPESATKLTDIAVAAAKAAVEKFATKGLKADQLAITLSQIDRTSKTVVSGDYRGDAAIYPASVVKLFYLAYAGELLETGKITSTPEFERAAHDMIVDSINDATGLIFDTITGTTGGPELLPKELTAWMAKRQAVNHWFGSLGYPALNACQKTWNEGPYGRERQGYGPKFELRNSLSPNVCARLMADISLDRVVTPGRCEWMRKFLSRAIPADSGETDEQANQFSGKVLPSGTKLWSKAGWTDSVRHDVVLARFKDGREYVWAIFTRDNSANQDLIPFVADQILAAIGEK